MKHKRTNRLHNSTAAIISYSLAVSGLTAQTSLENEKPETAATETLPTTVVTGTAAGSTILYQTESSTAALFSDTPLIETPFSVSVYNQDLIEDQRAFSLPEVLENDPSVALQMPGGFYGFQNLALRGFRVDNFNGYRVDGLPVIQTVAPLIDDKARVEVLKGPAALRYGFMPPGGAINLVTKQPTPEFSTSLSTDVNTFGNFYSQLYVSDTISSDKFGYRLVLGGEEFDSFYDNAGGNRLFGSLSGMWNATENLRVWGNVSIRELERNGYYGPMITANGNVLDTGVKTNIMQDWARIEQDVFEASTGFELRFDDSWKLMGSVNYQDSERFAELSYPYSVQENGDFTDGAFLNDKPSTWESWGVHTHVEGEFETGILKHDIVVGGQYRTYESYTDRSFPDVGPNNAFNLQDLPKPALGRVRSFDFEYEELGLFLTDTIELNEKWSVLLGARYGRYENTYPTDPASDDTVSEWSPTLALMYEPVKDVHTYATYTRGLQDGGFARRAAANRFEPLGVQESEQLELGVKTEMFDGRLAAELAVFQIEQDLAVLDASRIEALNGLQRHRGVELSLRGKITDNWQAGFATMLLDAEQVDTSVSASEGQRPQYVPEYQVNLWSVLEIPQVPGLALTGGVRFVDKQYLDQGGQFATDNYTVVDIGARYKFHTDNADWTVRLNIQNALDERYYESGEFYPGDAGYLSYGAPVSATLSLQVDF